MEDYRLIDIRTYRGEGMNAAILLTDFEVERKGNEAKGLNP